MPPGKQSVIALPPRTGNHHQHDLGMGWQAIATPAFKASKDDDEGRLSE